jgi:hypothetical protein
MTKRKKKLIRKKIKQNDMDEVKRMTRRKRKNGMKLSRSVLLEVQFRQENSVPRSRRLTQKLFVCSEFKGRHCIIGEDRLSRHF